MSMIGNLRRLSDAKLATLFAAPASIGDYLEQEGSPDDGDDEAFADLDIEKAWHGIHFMLNGSAWESRGVLGFLVTCGAEIGKEDVGYGPARGFTSVEVREISKALHPITKEALLAGYDAETMDAQTVYPGGWTEQADDDPEFMEYFVEQFEQLKDFVDGAAKEGEALIVFIN